MAVKGEAASKCCEQVIFALKSVHHWPGCSGQTLPPLPQACRCWRDTLKARVPPANGGRGIGAQCLARGASHTAVKG